MSIAGLSICYSLVTTATIYGAGPIIGMPQLNELN